MSTLVELSPADSSPSVRLHSDTLAASVVLLLVMTVAQRAIGFGRGVLFCRWLEPAQLGEWDVALGFLNLAAPLVVLGLPGCFGRYVEYFRQRGQLHLFLRRTAVVALAMAALAILGIVLARQGFSRLIFGTDAQSQTVVWLAAALAAVIANNTVCSLFIAARQYRLVTMIQFVQSLLFAIVALGLLASRPPGSTSVVIGWFAATALSTMLAIPWLQQWISTEPADRANPDRGGFWAKLLPFALWMWVTNLLSNLFEVIDRFMIVHHGGWPAEEALRQVGNYHSSRILPLLFVSVAVMLGSMITPHLSVDWEVGRREAVVRRLNFVIKCLLVLLVTASVMVLFGAPLLFELGFRNKFAGGLAVLPWTLIYCTWFGALAVTQNYLWCAERAGLASLPLLVGLLTNVACQIVLLPRFGLYGAVWSTAIANFTALVLLYRLSSWQGMQVDRGTWLLTLLPLAIAQGRWTALAAVVGVVIVAVSNDRLFSAGEKHEIAETFRRAARRLKVWLHPRTRQMSEPA